MIPIEVKLSVQVDDAVSLSVFHQDPLSVGLATPIQMIDGATYEGEYSVTPTAAVQVIPTENLRMRQNFVVNPIPSNYGLITWNGSTLFVS